MDTPLTIAGRTFRSRLIIGTGKYPSPEVMVAAHDASAAEMVTVAVRRVQLPGRPVDEAQQAILEHINTDRYMLLPNTAGCYTADDAIRTARLGREAGLSEWVKLEVIGDERTLFPDNAALVDATAVLVKEGFIVLPYTNDDPVTCRKLEDAGAAAVMPLGAPIGSGLGIQNPNKHSDHPGVRVGPGDRRRRRRHCLGCHARHGAGRRWRPDEHRHRRRRRSRGDGDGDEAGRRSGTPRLVRRPDPPQALRHRQ